MDFRQAAIGDKKNIDRILKNSPCPTFEYNFATVFLWQKPYDLQFAIEDEMLYVSSFEGEKSFLLPCGKGDFKKAVDKVISYANSRGFGANFYSVTESQREFLEKEYPMEFSFYDDRETADYIYKSESLINLTGKKLASKRNHINRFLSENPDWCYEAVTEDNIEEVFRMHDKWCEAADYGRDGLENEGEAVRNALKYFKELEFTGGLIRSGGEVVAFSIGEELNKNTYLIHFEKAFYNINGAYPMINREFAFHNCSEYEFINREDDNGDEGLRNSKLSYRPHEILKKYYVKQKY